MKVLLDTCIVSDIHRAHKGEILQLALHAIGEENCFVSVVTMGEITQGIYLLDDGKRKKELLYWVERLENVYKDRWVGIDANTAKIWGELTAQCRRAGTMVSMADGLIAASALAHGFHVMTANTKDFEATGAMLINPYQ